VDKVAIAVAGAGLIGREHIRVIRASVGARLSAIVDPSAAAAAAALEAGAPLFGSLGELFEKAKPDGVVLATPNQLHVEQGLECVRAGVAALVEKPVATSVAEGERFCAAVEAANARILVGHHRIHSPILATARRIVQEGTLGPLVAVIGTALFYKPDDYFDAAPWRREPGGGPILLNMIHEVGNLRALCGEIVAVQAFASSATRRHAVEDTVAINLRFASGALGTFLLSDTAASPRSWEQTSRENRSYPAYPDEDCYLIAGTDGSLAVPTMRLKTYARKADRSWWKPFEERVVPLERADPLARQIEHFCAVVRSEARPLVSARDGLQNLRVTEAIAEAARGGRIVATG
jgi:predicted dehydrogenase